MKVTFACGHTADLTGDENPPRCHCGSTRVVEVKARAPRFRGIVKGPAAVYEDLAPRPLTWSN
jgi:hypothetical protein